MARVYAVASAKGGVGKTTTTANLGTTLAMAGHDVVVVDGDLGMPNLAGALGVDPDGATLHDVLTGEAAVEAAVYEGPAGLSVLPGSNALEAFATANAKELEPVISALEASYDVVIIDTGAGLSDDTFVPLKLADEVVLVSTTEREALGDTEKTRQLGERIGADVVGVVLTRVNQSNPNADVVASLLDAGVIAVVPEDPSIREALSTQVPVVARSPDSIAAAGYRALAEALTGEPVPIPDGATESSESEADATNEADQTADPTDAAVADSDSDPDFDEDSSDDATEVEADTPETDEHTSVVNVDAAPAAASELDTEPEPASEPEADPSDVAAAVADDDGISADAESEPAFEAEPGPDADATDDDLASSIPFSGGAAEASDDPVDPDPAAAEDGDDPAVEADAVADPMDADAPVEPDTESEAEDADAPADPLAADAPDDSVVADPDSVGDEEPDTDPLAADLEAVTRGASAADEETLDDADDPVSDAAAGATGADPLAEDAEDDSLAAPATESPLEDSSETVVEASPDDADSGSDVAEDSESVDSEPTDLDPAVEEVDAAASGADEPLVAEAEPSASETDADADADESPEDGGDEEGVYTTSLVEEVESFDDDERDEKKKGFFSRFLG
ncbi:cell division ATPase MinD [Haloferax marisrubri]|uniref:Septum site-determining protein MinD n=1 Tax=Haloferax marisrubri TaxID=1544719 RepID=A0A2P4NU91_9EURY|nr:cell division ATPase MinD [Haloferax marisrubri]POG56724.1 septum site-determining protein MinD [Haloferax marisrubri]